MSTTANYIADLRFFAAERDTAARNYERSVQKAFPVGSTVHSGKSGRGIVACTVLAHGFGDRIKVRSQTGRVYWITAYHVVEAGLNKSLV